MRSVDAIHARVASQREVKVRGGADVARSVPFPPDLQHDVEPAERLDCLVDQLNNVLLLANVCNDCDGLWSASGHLGDQLDRLVRGVLANVGADDVRAFLGERESRLEADAVASTSDDGDFVGQSKRCDLVSTGAMSVNVHEQVCL